MLGEDELAAGRVAVKPLRGDGEQQSVALEELANYIENALH